jgi:M6 family metalloprotease-like protein
MNAKLFVASLMLAAASQALAVPALPGLRPVTLPDGTTVMLERVGDEHRNFTLNADGALLMPTATGFYQLATLNADGRLVASSTPVKFNSPEIQERLKLADSLTAADESSLQINRAAQVGLYPSVDFPDHTGSPKALVVLVDFQDIKFRVSDESYHSPAVDAHTYFNNFLNQEGFSEDGGTGCAAEFFKESSMGIFTPEFDLYGPVTMSQKSEYYASNEDSKAYMMAVEACRQLDSTINFADYDTDGNGVIDNVFIIFAGQGRASYGGTNTVWPHQSNIKSYGYKFDGKTLGNYACVNEWKQYSADGIGTFVHEFSHVMGLPDLYDTNYGTAYNYTPGSWSVLAQGPYNNGGCTPPVYSAYERNAMGWCSPVELTADGETHTLTDLRTTNQVYSISNPNNANEFFLLENRQQGGWDTYLPGSGMLVWHVDYNKAVWNQNTVNTLATHQYVDLVEADGIGSKSSRNANDCFPGNKNITFLKPNWWDESATGITLRKISLDDGTISFLSATDNENDWYGVSDAVEMGPLGTTDFEVRGYIVGYVKSGSLSQKNVVFSNENVTVTSNIILCDKANPTADDYKQCLPVQLPANSDVRAALNLQDNPTILGRKVSVTGTLSSYLSTTGLKAPTAYSFLTDANDSAISEVTAADLSDSDATWYTLQGQRIAAPTSGGIYLRHTSAGTAKVRVP